METIKSPEMVLAPSHTITDLIWSKLAFILSAKNFAVTVSSDSFSFLNAFWKVWVWVPFTVKARVVAGHWDGRSELETIVASWVASELTGLLVVFTFDLAVDWAVKVGTLVGFRDTRWIPETAPWESWLVVTGF